MYSHLVTLERWSLVLHMWVSDQFRTTADALCLHESALSIQQRHGTVRNVQIKAL